MLKSIVLGGLTSHAQPTHYKNRPFSILLPSLRRTYIIEAASEKDQKAWVQRINDAWENLKKKK
jgi:hypothetical protein